MNPALFWLYVIEPGVRFLESATGRTREYNTLTAKRMLMAIAIQETNLDTRKQRKGPARSWWQFEGGPRAGIAEVLTAKGTRAHAAKVCKELAITASTQAVHEAIEHCDLLACSFARLLLWIDPRPLPYNIDIDASWDYYLRNWRPGKPDRSRWEEAIREALSHG